MYRRRYLVLAGTVLVAGCQSEADEPDPTETATPTATPTPTETETQTETETEESTETETEPETPSPAERAAAAIEDARGALRRAHTVYLSAAGDADTILDVGPQTTGLDADRIDSECEEGLGHLDRARETATSDQEHTISLLRTATQWMRMATEMQALMAEVVENVQAAGAAAEDESFDVMIDSFDAAAEEATDGMSRARGRIGDPGLPAFREIDQIDADAIGEKNTNLSRESITFEELGEHLGDAAHAAETLERADRYVASDPDEAESLALGAADTFGDIERTVDEIGPQSFAGVTVVVTDAMDDCGDLADEVIDDARRA